jgi:hypothetical protein
VARLETRLVAKLAGQARQARCLAFQFLIVSWRTFVADLGIVLGIVLIAIGTILTCGTVFAFHVLSVAVLACAAQCALGAAFRVRELPRVAQGAICGLRGLADLANRALVACEETCLVGKLARQTREARLLAFGVLVFSFHTIRTCRRILALAHFADIAPVARLETRLVAKLAGQARQAQCLAFQFLIVALGAGFALTDFNFVCVLAR